MQDKDFCGKGYMPEAVKVLEKEFFERFNFERIQIRCDAKNKNSFKVAKKCEYKLEGIMRNKEFSKYFDGLRDMRYYAKLREDYFT